mgnify:CR=1 FL=1
MKNLYRTLITVTSILTVTIMVPHIALGQYGFLVDYNDGELLKIELDNPTNEVAIGTSMQFLTDAEFGSNKVLYALPLSGTQFYQIDTTNAAIIQIGTSTPLDGHDWSGLAYDVTTSTLYASSTTGNSASAFYTIDVSTGTASHIGTTTTAQSVADIAFDNNGQMYAYNLSHTIYLIDKTNGIATLLGNTGFNAAGPWHGLDFSYHNNTMYMGTYNSITWVKTIRTVNLTTGYTTSVGTINHSTGGFAITHSEPAPEIAINPTMLVFDSTAVGSSSVEMLTIYNTGTATLTISNISSTDTVFSTNLTNFDVSPGDSQMVQVLFAPIEPITYEGNLYVISNDSGVDTLAIPVSGVGFWLVGIELDDYLPKILELYPNYPNPFNPVTTLSYDLPHNSFVNITIYDVLSREVRTLVNQTQEAGFKSVIWDASNDYGKPVSAGVYLYQIQAGEFVQTKKMVLLK